MKTTNIDSLMLFLPLKEKCGLENTSYTVSAFLTCDRISQTPIHNYPL